nr:hypothetical protein L203_02347 [Cryptococcus depauperatus CBS 7841]
MLGALCFILKQCIQVHVSRRRLINGLRKRLKVSRVEKKSYQALLIATTRRQMSNGQEFTIQWLCPHCGALYPGSPQHPKEYELCLKCCFPLYLPPRTKPRKAVVAVASDKYFDSFL